MSLHRCSKCTKNKPADQFHRSNTRPQGVQRYCKECKKKIDTTRKKLYYVYYLPRERYVGMTKHVTKRMQRHRERGKDTRGYRIMLSTKNVKAAHLFESLLHLFGFKGFRY
jgi:hypothetical protein